MLRVRASRQSVADECRETALGFLSGVTSGWTKGDLASWLVGPYARATRHLKRGDRPPPRVARGSISHVAIEDLLVRVRTQIVASLELAALPGGALDFSGEVLVRSYVQRAQDEWGLDLWIPIDGAHMRLRDRVRSLLVAHYMNDPVAYDALFVCHRCEDVVFDEAAKESGVCSRHLSESGIMLRYGFDEVVNIDM